MEFDFYQQYQAYSNADLLKILKQSSHYQPAAIAAATKILNERQVTEEDVQLAERYFEGIDNAKKAKQEKIDTLKSQAADFFEPVIHPGETVEPYKWARIFLLVVAIDFIWQLYKAIYWWIHFLGCEYCTVDFYTIVPQLYTLILLPVIFVLLFKRKRWGWILLFADHAAGGVMLAFQLFLYVGNHRLYYRSASPILTSMLIHIAFIAFLWRNNIALYFQVSAKTKRDTALLSASLGMLVILIIITVIH